MSSEDTRSRVAAAQEAAEALPAEEAAEPAPVEQAAEPAPAAEEEAPVGEESFADAQAPPAPAPAQAADAAAPEVDYLALAQRTQADFDNFRRRAAREQSLAGERGVGRVAKELLPALDHLELALQAVEQDAAHAEIAKGFRLVQDELAKALERVGVQGFSPAGEAFDPTEHEAMTQQPFEGVESGTVAQVYQRGYRLNGSVLRPARVVVAA